MSELVNAIAEFNKRTKIFFESVNTMFYYLSHPGQLISMLWNCAVTYSFSICLFIIFLSLILYLIGIKKASGYAKIAFFAYLSIQVFNWVM